ncbi:MAG: SWIM zinc finger domain-containing protein, partial [Phycisphaerales bacterium]|nr:SWIM zinc finger domain-containing protein [Phycisphaerales bacterium]
MMDTTTLRHRLSRLSYAQAVKVLGADGKSRLSAGSARYQNAIDLEEAARWDGDERLSIDLDGATVTVSLSAERTQRLAFCCSVCGDGEGEACEHIAAAVSIILEEKLLLGLAKPPKERVAVENLSDEQLVRRALAEREERAKTERMRVSRPDGSERIWGDYAVTNPASGKTYRVALRGRERGESYCDCPDFRKNTLGTCKHIMRVLSSIKRKGLKAAKPWKPTGIEVYLHYAAAVPELRVNLPEKLDADASKIVAVFRGKVIDDLPAFVKVLRRLATVGINATVFPDAMEHIQRRLFRIHIADLTAAVRKGP